MQGIHSSEEQNERGLELILDKDMENVFWDNVNTLTEFI